MNNKETRAEKLRSYPRQTRFLNFYNFVILPLGIIERLYRIYAVLFFYDIPAYIGLITVLVNIFILGLLIAAFIGMLKLTKWGFVINIIWYSFFALYNLPLATTEFIVIFIGMLPFALTLIYLCKRKSLFWGNYTRVVRKPYNKTLSGRFIEEKEAKPEDFVSQEAYEMYIKRLDTDE